MTPVRKPYTVTLLPVPCHFLLHLSPFVKLLKAGACLKIQLWLDMRAFVPLIQSAQSILSSNFSKIVIALLIKAQLEVHPNPTDISQLPAL